MAVKCAGPAIEKLGQSVGTLYFANTLGGIIFIGISDNKEIKGLAINKDDLQKKISQANRLIYPLPTINIEIQEIENKEIVAIIVHRTNVSTFHSIGGVIFIRVGSTTARLEGDAILEFLRNRQILLFEEVIEPYAKIEDMDSNRIKSYLDKRNQSDYLKEHSIRDFILSKKLAILQPDLKIKSLALLFFSHDPQSYYYYSIIKLVRFDGTEPIKVIAYEDAKGPLPEIIEHAHNFVKRFMTQEFRIEGLRREEIPFIPEEAVREAIINAVAHRDYFNKNETQISIFDDRIEITNPGGLPEGMNKDLLGKLSIQRNPGIYHLLKDYGYMEGIGSGYSKIFRLISETGLVKPDYIITKDIFRLIFWNKKLSIIIPGLNERQSRMLNYIRNKKQIKAKEYADLSNVTHPTAVADLKRLKEQGYVKKIGSYRGAYYILGLTTK